MKLAPLQLADYFLTDLTLQANPGFDPEKPVDDCIEFLHVTPHVAQVKDLAEKGSEWLVSLEIAQKTPDGQNLPYAFSLRIQGTVSASPHLLGTTLQRAIHANGPAMLFGAAREIIRAATGRGPWPAVIIPSTNFFSGLPLLESPASAQEKKAAPVKKTAAKRAPTRKPKNP
jgi:preprotein translocase subunit SecB